MNPGDKIAKIRDELVERGKNLGLILLDFSFKPGKVDGVHQVDAMFRVQTDDELEDLEKRRIDATIKKMEQGEKQSQKDAEFLQKGQASEDAVRKLEEQLKDPRKGLLE